MEGWLETPRQPFGPPSYSHHPMAKDLGMIPGAPGEHTACQEGVALWELPVADYTQEEYGARASTPT